ncbi:MAG: DNA gyrase inhibitor YacG [Sinobacterium sp.]|nr:DNA gyrase inhibitor YacG [Sinobacterium sp.]
MSKNKAPQYNCPKCSSLLEWTSTNEYRPFCSAQCKNIDLIGWAEESHVIEGSSIFGDLMSDELSSAELLDDMKKISDFK